GALLLVALLVAPQAFAQNASGGAATAATKSTPRAAASAPAVAKPATPATANPKSAAPSARLPAAARAVPGFPVTAPLPPPVDLKSGEGAEALHLSGAVGLVVFLGALTLLPAMFLLMTSFTRILIVLHFLRSAIGTQTTPPTQLLVAFAVLLTGVVMNPVLKE